MMETAELTKVVDFRWRITHYVTDGGRFFGNSTAKPVKVLQCRYWLSKVESWSAWENVPTVEDKNAHKTIVSADGVIQVGGAA